jgi:hypothetical protein
LILFKIKDKETLVRVEATLIASGTPSAPVSDFSYRVHINLVCRTMFLWRRGR